MKLKTKMNLGLLFCTTFGAFISSLIILFIFIGLDFTTDIQKIRKIFESILVLYQFIFWLNLPLLLFTFFFFNLLFKHIISNIRVYVLIYPLLYSILVGILYFTIVINSFSSIIFLRFLLIPLVSSYSSSGLFYFFYRNAIHSRKINL